MKPFSILVTLALFGLTSQPTLSAPLQQEQSIGPPPVDSRCSLSAGGRVIDYGILSRGQLQDATTGANALTPGKRTVMVNVVCPYTQPMRLTLRREPATNGNLSYGDRAYVRVRLQDALLDGQSIQIASSAPDGTLSSSPASTLELQPGQTFAAVADGTPAKGRSLTLHLEIEPIFAGFSLCGARQGRCFTST